MHPDLIFNALGGITGKPDLTGRVEAVHCLDQPDGSDADQVILTAAGRIVFFGHMGHQTQVMADQGIPGSPVARLQCGERLTLLGCPQGPRKAAGFQMQRQVENPGYGTLEKNRQNLQHKHHLGA